MSNDDVVHMAKRSWWDGSAKTLCGLQFEKPNRIVFPRLFGRKVCPACEAVNKAR